MIGSRTATELHDMYKECSNAIHTYSMEKLRHLLVEATRRCQVIQKELNQKEAFFNHVFEQSPQATIIVSQTGQILGYNTSFTTLFGFVPDKYIGMDCQELLVPQEFEIESQKIVDTVYNGHSVYAETYRLKADSEKIPVSLVASPVTINGKIEGVVFKYAYINDRKTFENQLSDLSLYDGLTRIPNKELFIERLSGLMNSCGENESAAYVLIVIDVERYRSVMDSYGRYYGDQMILQISERLQASLRNSDTLARIRDDGFALLLEGHESISMIMSIARRLSRNCNIPITVGDKKLYARACLGIVMKTMSYRNVEDVLRDADIAVNKARGQDGDRIRIFNKAMHELAVETLEMENELRQALENREIILHFQPILSGIDESIHGFEVLARWSHPEKGLLYPDRFIPVAESTGLIVPLGKYIIEESLKQLKEWQHYFVKHSLSLSVNVSVRQLLKDDFGKHVISMIKKYHIPPECLQLEVTETVLMKNRESAIRQLEQVRQTGIRLVIDDFGTGYSSLSYLQKFPVDTLKIDKSFIQRIAHTEDDNEIVKIIVTLAKNLRLNVVAEGVEEQIQLDYLKKLSCDYIQGYLFSKPVGRDDIFKMLEAME